MQVETQVDWRDLAANSRENKEWIEELLRVKEHRVHNNLNTLSISSNYVVIVEVDNCLDNSNISSTSYNTYS